MCDTCSICHQHIYFFFSWVPHQTNKIGMSFNAINGNLYDLNKLLSVKCLAKYLFMQFIYSCSELSLSICNYRSIFTSFQLEWLICRHTLCFGKYLLQPFFLIVAFQLIINKISYAFFQNYLRISKLAIQSISEDY